jgi:hypothetical protein
LRCSRDRPTCLPWRFLADKEVRIPDAKADLTPRLTNVTIAERLESSSKEGRRSWKMSYCKSSVRDWHYANGGEIRTKREYEDM